MIKVGKVVAVDEAKARVRVQLLDNDEMVTYWLQIAVPKAQNDKFYWIPDVGELVLCAFLEHGLEQGFVIGAVYNEKDQTPVQDKEKFHIKFKDGSWIEYDRREHKLTAFIKGDINITASGNITLQAPVVNIVGNLEVQGNIHATGSIIDEGGNTNHHSH